MMVMSYRGDSLCAMVITTLFDFRLGVGMLEAMNNMLGLSFFFNIQWLQCACKNSRKTVRVTKSDGNNNNRDHIMLIFAYVMFSNAL